VTEVAAGTQKILWPAGVGHSWKVTAPTAFPPSAIRRTAPITRSERDIVSAEDSGRNHPFVHTTPFDGDNIPLLRTRILSPGRAAAPVSNCRGILIFAPMGGHWVGSARGAHPGVAGRPASAAAR